MRFSLPHNGSDPATGRPGNLRCRQMHRLPLLHLGLPWGVPTAEWDSLAPKIQKCTHCADRDDQPVPLTRNGKALTGAESKKFRVDIVEPACVKACPADTSLRQ